MTWFIHHEEKILGPFSTKRIQDDLKSGNISYGAYIWAKGQVEWIPVSDWENNLQSILNHSQSAEGVWKLRTPEGVTENLNFQDVVKKLKELDSLKLVAISSQSENNWTPVYSSFSFMEALNLSRRNFLRAPLMGLAKITKANSRFSYVVKTASIGQGGIGVYGLGPNFEPGTQVSLKIESEDLGTKVIVNGTIVYNTDQGFVGIRFAKLPAESISVIVDYMKRFQTEEAELGKKVA